MSKHLEIVHALLMCVALTSSMTRAHAAVIGDAPTPVASTSSQGTPSPRYHLRCWQDGRLLFEQVVATLPTDAGRSTRIQAKDLAREPVIVYETRNATCMARALRPAR
jgi:hypothetical protein